jgi:hypothetical protein
VIPARVPVDLGRRRSEATVSGTLSAMGGMLIDVNYFCRQM